MAFEPLQSGDPIKPTAFEWNAMLSAGQRAMAGAQGIAPPGALQSIPPNWIKVKNVTGRALRRYTGYRVGPCLWTLPASGATIGSTDKGGTTLAENIYELSDNADPTQRPVVVIQQPLDVDAIGWAAASGVTMVKVLNGKPIEYMAIAPNHDASEPGFDGAFVTSQLGGELRLITPPIESSSNTAHSFALAVFNEGGIRSQAWSAKTGSSLGLGTAIGNIVFSTVPGAFIASRDELNFTGWKKVTYNTDSQGWQCKRPGIWRVTSSTFTSFAAHTTTQLTIGEFGLAVARSRSGTESRIDHVWQQVTMNGGAVESTQCFVDYVIFAFDDILTLRPKGIASRVNSVTSQTVNDQSLIDMRGYLTAELVTPYWSSDDRAGKYIPPPPPP